ncbi:MAG: hypothetical protein IT529_16940 [Burkholderiales bacterium]|nr:hypothetical protein [Burkholderiales bacterium]
MSRRTLADLLLFAVTAAELALLFRLTPAFSLADWVYVVQHAVVLGIALTRGAPVARDSSPATIAAVLVAYTYPYAQVACLRWAGAEAAWPAGGLVMVTLAACLSCASLLALGRRFGVRPALRGLATGGPYRLVRHPMYLAYVIADIGYNLQGANAGTLLLVAAGWAALLHRIRAEERILSRHGDWPAFAARTRWRLVPGLW